MFLSLVIIIVSCAQVNNSLELNPYYEIWIIAGQSNAYGMGERNTTYIPQKEKCVKWSELENKLVEPDKDSGEMSLRSIGLPFAYAYTQHSNKSIILIQVAKGGSSIIPYSLNGYNWAYDGYLRKNADDKINACISFLKNRGIDLIKQKFIFLLKNVYFYYNIKIF